MLTVSYTHLDVYKRQILYIPNYALKFVNSNVEARTLIMDRYRDRAVRAMANAIDLFQGVPRTFIDNLIPRCEIERYDLRGITLIKQGEEGDALYLVRDGFVQVVREREDGTKRCLLYTSMGEMACSTLAFSSRIASASNE